MVTLPFPGVAAFHFGWLKFFFQHGFPHLPAPALVSRSWMAVEVLSGKSRVCVRINHEDGVVKLLMKTQIGGLVEINLHPILCPSAGGFPSVVIL